MAGEAITERVVQAACEWCGGPVTYPGHGPMPRYCSRGHRQRAYEARTAAARLGRDVDAGVVRTEPAERVVERVRLRRFPQDADGWATMLGELTRQLRDGELGVTSHGRIRYLLAQAAVELDRQEKATAARLVIRQTGDRLLAAARAGNLGEPTTLGKLAAAYAAGIGQIRAALEAIAAGGQARIVGVGDAPVDVATIAEHTRFRVLAGGADSSLTR